jgi:HK97 family phage prohead protease
MNKNRRDITFKGMEIRSAQDEGTGKKFIEGVIPYNSKSLPIWGTVEIIDPSAFSKTIHDKAEVRALWNHNDNYILGNTKNNTLILENSNDKGLVCKCELPDTSYARDLFEIVSRGDVKTMSFGFCPVKWVDSENGKLRTLKEVRLFEISFGVPFPAYEKTDSKTYMRGFKKMKTNIDDINAVLEKEELTENDIEILRQFVNELNKIILDNSLREEETGKEEEAADKGKPPDDDTSQKDKDTSAIDPKTIKEGNSESVKQDIISLIETLFSIEKEKEMEKEPE